MSDDELVKLFEQQVAILAATTAVKEQLEVNEWRRKCCWLFASINRAAERLGERLQDKGRSLNELLEALDCYVTLVFKTSQDLSTVFTCLGLIAQTLEEAEEADAPSSTEIWREIQRLVDDIGTLETGDPPSLSVADKLIRDLRPELQDAERAAVRQRFENRSRASIDKMFDRRRAEAERNY